MGAPLTPPAASFLADAAGVNNLRAVGVQLFPPCVIPVDIDFIVELDLAVVVGRGVDSDAVAARASRDTRAQRMAFCWRLSVVRREEAPAWLRVAEVTRIMWARVARGAVRGVSAVRAVVVVVLAF